MLSELFDKVKVGTILAGKHLIVILVGLAFFV